MSQLIDIFLQPGKTFAQLREKPTFLLPLALLAVLSAVMMLLYFNQVDPEWYLDHTVAAGGEMSASEQAQARKMIPGARTMGYITAVMSLLGLLLITAISALYYMLAGKVTGNAVSFRHGMSLASWSSMPLLLGTLVGLVGVLSMTPQTSLESLMLLNIDPLLVQLPVDHAWATVARSFSLLHLWVLFLVALGWRTWGRTGWLQAAVVALLPSVLVYGAMAAYAVLR